MSTNQRKSLAGTMTIVVIFGTTLPLIHVMAARVLRSISYALGKVSRKLHIIIPYTVSLTPVWTLSVAGGLFSWAGRVVK